VRVLVTGAGGMVGGALATALGVSGHEVWGTVRARPAPAGVVVRRVHLEEGGEFRRVVDEARPDLVVHAAYSTGALDRDVVAATETVATACRQHEVALVHLSTDAVFDGEAAPYAENDLPAPVHAYGRAKAWSEAAVVEAVPDAAVVRLALVAHLDRTDPDPASCWLIDATRRHEPATLFTDEVRSVVRRDDLVWGLGRVVELERAERAGRWHLGGPEPLTREELGRIVIDRFGLDDSRVRRGSAAEMPGPRPRDVSLSCGRAAGRLGWAPRPVDTVTGHGEGP
jgi:dTDP-4-dehydrorhamnose reductase